MSFERRMPAGKAEEKSACWREPEDRGKDQNSGKGRPPVLMPRGDTVVKFRIATAAKDAFWESAFFKNPRIDLL